MILAWASPFKEATMFIIIIINSLLGSTCSLKQCNLTKINVYISLFLVVGHLGITVTLSCGLFVQILTREVQAR